MTDPQALLRALEESENRFRVLAETAATLEKSHRSLERSLERRTLELQASAEELDIFSSAVSHDLRAPLRSVLAYTQILKDTINELSDEQLQVFSRIDSNVNQMMGLIEDMLNLSQARRAPLRREAVSVKDLIFDVQTQLKAEILGRKIIWQIEELGTVPADRGLLRQVLVNLIANALKFTRERSPAVIRVHRDEDETHAVFHVTDNGVGFPQDYAERLFKPFERLTPVEGRGLGLFIVERIISRHGGQVIAQGRPGNGATFKFTLPKAA